MSNVVASLTDYVDQSSMELLTSAITGSKTAGLVGMQVGIKSKAALQLFETTATFQDGTACGFNASDTTTYTQREIEVQPVKVQESLCQRDLQPKWTQLLLSAGQEYSEADVPAIYMERKMQVIANALEQADWQGEDGVGAGNLGFYDGFITVIDGAGTAVDGNTGAVTVATGITEANIIDILQGIYKSIPEAVIMEDDLTIFLGDDSYRKYICALIDANLFHYAAGDRAGSTRLHGTNIRIESVPGLNGTDRMFAAQASNLIIGYDMEGEEDELKMWYSDDDDLVKSSVRFMRGTQVAFPAQIVEFTLVP